MFTPADYAFRGEGAGAPSSFGAAGGQAGGSGEVILTLASGKKVEAPKYGVQRHGPGTYRALSPGACAGVTAVTEVPPQLLTAAVTPPKDTEGKAGVHTKPVPVRTTLSPPELLPVTGARDVSVAVPLATPPRLASW